MPLHGCATGAAVSGWHLTLLQSAVLCSTDASSTPPWLSRSSSGTIMRTPMPPPGAAEPKVREKTTCAARMRSLSARLRCLCEAADGQEA